VTVPEFPPAYIVCPEPIRALKANEGLQIRLVSNLEDARTAARQFVAQGVESVVIFDVDPVYHITGKVQVEVEETLLSKPRRKP